MAGQAHHFRQYAPEQISYAIERYTNEVNRLLVPGTIMKRAMQGRLPLMQAAQALAGQSGEGFEPKIRLSLRPRGHSILIRVEDNGPGMDKDTQQRVFEPFFTTKEVGGGTGLGLSVSYYIVTNNHMGTISVASSPGQGAKFTIRLPLDGEPPGEQLSKGENQ